MAFLPKSKRWRRRIIALGGFVLLVALFYAEEDWRGERAWEIFKSEWEAKGEKFDFKDFIPPPVPDDQNFAMAPIFDTTDKLLSAEWRRQHRNPRYIIPHNGLSDDDGENGETEWDTNLVDRLDMTVYGRLDGYYDAETNATGDWAKGTFTDLKLWQAYYRAPARTNEYSGITTNVYPVSPQPQSPAADVLVALSKYDSAIEELRQASQRPYSRFPVAYEQENKREIPLYELSLKRCSEVLQLCSLAELQSGQNDKALADVKLSLYLVNSLRTEPFSISHLVRAAMFQMTLQPVYEGLAQHKWSDEQLTELDHELVKFDFLADCKLSMRGEMGMRSDITDYLPRHPEQYYSMDDDIHDLPYWQRIAWRLIPIGWFYQNRLNYARLVVEYCVPQVSADERTVSPALARRADAIIETYANHCTFYNFINSRYLPAFRRMAERFGYLQSCVNLSRVAVALERYQLAHGEYPETLDALAPQFIEKIPHDIIGGQPLHYHRRDDGKFLLYSVGWNETDDGGQVVLTKNGLVDREKGDWVWQYPQK
jgi:hypothetical protein